MKRAEALERIHQQLIRRRDEIFLAHSRSEETRRVLTEPEVEFEETAQKESIADTLAQLDEQEEKEVAAIDQALEKMKLGEYGFCQVCKKPIAMRRLQALPWALLCVGHAKETTTRPQAAAPEEAPLPPEYSELSGSELGDIIADELREDGEVELEELRIAVRNGALHLEGFLPTKGQHRRLLEIVQDHMEFGNVIDEVVVSRAPWEREDRTPGMKEIEDVLDELQAGETEIGQGSIASRKAGVTMIPEDTLVPEER